jgi:casein kinase II subunit beta
MYRPTLALDSALSEDDSNRIPDATIVETSAELLYGLVHQRYILTRQGLQAMVRPAACSFACSQGHS